jgi:hypothetical protein
LNYLFSFLYSDFFFPFRENVHCRSFFAYTITISTEMSFSLSFSVWCYGCCANENFTHFMISNSLSPSWIRCMTSLEYEQQRQKISRILWPCIFIFLHLFHVCFVHSSEQTSSERERHKHEGMSDHHTEKKSNISLLKPPKLIWCITAWRVQLCPAFLLFLQQFLCNFKRENLPLFFCRNESQKREGEKFLSFHFLFSFGYSSWVVFLLNFSLLFVSCSCIELNWPDRESLGSVEFERERCNFPSPSLLLFHSRVSESLLSNESEGDDQGMMSSLSLCM